MHMTVTECGQILWLIYWANTTEILGVHILGLHAADLIREASNAIAMDIFIKVCTCPLLSHFYMKLMGRTNTISNIFKCFNVY
jgi:pyruvate/2-oxoglutarate dehydrogenase complex dihydrolipoamide dehydrogenase (E3) component